jgi:tRNA U38,U39,U40 pseudouridine synthase TruA
MIRRLVFMQVAVAQRKRIMSEFLQAIIQASETSLQDRIGNTAKSRIIHGMAPARGLVLEEVHYPAEALGLDEDT